VRGQSSIPDDVPLQLELQLDLRRVPLGPAAQLLVLVNSHLTLTILFSQSQEIIKPVQHVDDDIITRQKPGNLFY
jgi:hypothetical protein